MCGVIGYLAPNVTLKDLDNLTTLLEESQVRGRHSTGVSYILEGEIKTVIEKDCASVFISRRMREINADLWREGSIRLIGHTRYATSGETPQPIHLHDISLAMNGVISQADPSTWGHGYTTDNDAEILQRELLCGGHAFQRDFENASIAACALYHDGRLLAFRNGRRPLWRAQLRAETVVFSSTAQILARALDPCGAVELIKPGTVYRYWRDIDQLKAQYIVRSREMEDLQCA